VLNIHSLIFLAVSPLLCSFRNDDSLHRL
jgi:hypothetical protein